MSLANDSRGAGKTARNAGRAGHHAGDPARNAEELARWDVLNERVEGDFAVFDVLRQRRRRRSDGREGDFSIVRPRDWVVILAVTPARELVLVRQFRVGVNDFTWELPAGCREAGESPVATAERELREETGFLGGNGKLLGWNHPNPAIQTNRCWYVFVPDARPHSAPEWDAQEEIETCVVPLTEAYRWGRTGRITHALALVGLYLLQAIYPENGFS